MVCTTTIITFLATLSHAQAIRFLGRVNPTTKELTWPGTGVSFTFTGTSAVVTLGAVSGTSSFNLRVDGGEPTLISDLSSKKISTTGLAQGNHTVVLRKRSETGFGTVTIGNITVDGSFGPDAIPKRKIEIIGDSITVGYGLDGTLPCTDSAIVQNNPKTYGALAADALGADYSVVAWSGKGVTRNYASGQPDDSPIMPQLWTRHGANDADNSYTFPATATPDAVVINLGTNDFSYLNVRPALNATFFTDAFIDFVGNIRGHYPDAEYFLVTSPMLNDNYPSAEDAQKTTHRKSLESVITHFNSTKFHLVDWPSQGSDVGCDYHPNEATHAAGAKLLVDAIKGALNW
ncbi:carbohydrate esterase family 2 protein [Aaosphaeria arxii CBS 175.79]|uniref:Carbohydrate esterase family 2 protein n=1 Tax=Aaosphaeria arxii CBS 175.79 TaxID=1450172 RepID=A0A6A5X8T2_9PLEO|nr:carbohydrate esterase family 2 protein [Aaosphaeria arxii CBS 175.79]KAF2009362.1 carbohydrate esterase family 2 protein [Aaosphaeria arxii CBS 175.79]